MNRGSSAESWSVTRRTVIASVTSAGFPILSGCFDDSKAGEDEQASSGHAEPEEDKYGAIRTNLENIFEAINRFPISENGDFVFDVHEFEANFNFENLLEETSTVQERLEVIEPKSDRKFEALRSVAKIAELRIRVRLTTHQAIAAGLSYGNRLSRREYAEATETIQHGRKFLEQLVATVRDIVNEMKKLPINSMSIEGYEPYSIQNTQSVLLEIVQWCALIYRSFQYASVGFELFENGAEKIDDESVAAAKSNFERADVQFTNAQKVLDRAHGRGRHIGYIVPIVRKLRCVLPIYRDTSERFADSFTEWESGGKDEARRIAREVIVGVDQRMAQCEDGEAI